MYIRGMPKGIEGVGAKTKISPHTMPLSNINIMTEMILITTAKNYDVS